MQSARLWKEFCTFRRFWAFSALNRLISDAFHRLIGSVFRYCIWEFWATRTFFSTFCDVRLVCSVRIHAEFSLSFVSKFFFWALQLFSFAQNYVLPGTACTFLHLKDPCINLSLDDLKQILKDFIENCAWILDIINSVGRNKNKVFSWKSWI